MNPPVDLGPLESLTVVRGVAKYEALRARMAEMIERGAWPGGARLPNETALAHTTSFSLGTVQRALRELTDQGYVIRRQGHGTFVADRRRQMAEPLHCCFDDGSGDGFMAVFTRVVSRARVCGQGPWSRALGPAVGEVIRLDRAFDIGHAFTVASFLYMSARRFGRLLGMSETSLDGANIKKLLHERFGISVREVTQAIRIESLPPPACTIAGVPEGAIGLAIRSTASAANADVIYYQELYVPQTGYALVTRSTLRPG